MAKYDPLHAYFKRQRAPELELTFREIENLLGRLLPRSAEHPDWWVERPGDTGRTVQVRAWAEAGYNAQLMVGADRVKFVRTKPRS